jgi:hypothetical protein
VAGRGAALEGDQASSGEPRHREWSRTGALGQLVSGTHGDRQLLARELEPFELVGRLDLQRERDVETAVVEHLDHPLSGPFLEADLDLRIRLGKSRQGCRDVELPPEQHRANGDVAADQPAELVHVSAQRLGLGEDGSGAGRDQLAGLGRVHGSGRAVQQLRTQLPLELPDLVRERRLRHVQLVGGTREVPVSRHRFEVAKLPYLHVRCGLSIS